MWQLIDFQFVDLDSRSMDWLDTGYALPREKLTFCYLSVDVDSAAASPSPGVWVLYTTLISSQREVCCNMTPVLATSHDIGENIITFHRGLMYGLITVYDIGEDKNHLYCSL